MAKGRKATGRTNPIYPRVSNKALNWLDRAMEYTGKSQAELVDHLITDAATNIGNKDKIREFFGFEKTQQQAA